MTLQLPETLCRSISITLDILRSRMTVTSKAKNSGLRLLKGIENHFLAPNVLFFSLSWLLWHFLHLTDEKGFFPPHLKQILKNNLRFWAICFLTASVMGIYISQCLTQVRFLPFYFIKHLYKNWNYLTSNNICSLLK